jgi:hypothetical protein
MGDRRNDEPEALPPEDRPLDDVRERVERIQRQHRGKIRWRISKHTAELAIRALGSQERVVARSGKSRRRKRHKRLL